MIEAVKNTERARSEYRFISAFEMDARYYGRQEGRQEGIQEGRREGMQAGIAQGFADGSYQKALETAKLMRKRDYPPAEICLMTGLSRAEVEAL